MIDPIELRKGSIFFDAGDEQSYFAIEYFEKDFAVYRNGSFKQRMDSDCFQPVELTPEILEAAGFHWSIYHQAYHFGDFLCNEFYDLNECYPKGFQLSTFKKSTLIGEPFFYLHQLQNLFGCLCGKELVIDLQKLNKQP